MVGPVGRLPLSARSSLATNFFLEGVKECMAMDVEKSRKKTTKNAKTNTAKKLCKYV